MRARPSRFATMLALVVVLVLACTAMLRAGVAMRGRWSEQEKGMLRSLTLASLEPLAADPSNRFADDSGAAQLGRALFFDARFSSTGTVSCASCHVANRDFQDDLPRAKGVGTTARRTMPVAGTAHSAWMFWDGRADSQWAQAL